MKQIKSLGTLFVLLCTHVYVCFSQDGTWVWMAGSDTVRAAPVYGVQGVAAPNNCPGGMYGMASWIDHNGNLWLYGGTTYNLNMHYSDLWKYDCNTNMWTWMKGPGRTNCPAVYSERGAALPSNNPAAKLLGFLCWTDKHNNLWLFGGEGLQSSDDLWMYNIDLNEWIWVNGNNDNFHYQPVYGNYQQESPGNTPGSRRITTVSWLDEDNNLWLYGGAGGLYYQRYDDLWKYNTSTNEWAWMKGPQGFQSDYNYGVKGVESPSNLPPARAGAMHWQDGNYFYLYGGGIYDGGQNDYYSDVWRFNVATNNWTWVAGDTGINLSGRYTEHCNSNDGEFPMPRCGVNAASQSLYCPAYVYGNGLEEGYDIPMLSDLWYFNTQSLSWNWVSGLQGFNDLGNYGQKGVLSNSNRMPSRNNQCEWTDANGVLWIFGGVGRDTTKRGRYPCCQVQTKNDLWKFIPDTSCVNITARPTSSTSVDIYIPNAFTPNGDGVNDRFTVFGKNITQYEIKIFNRAGELIYLSKDATEVSDTTRGWDGTYKGKLQETGVYVYYVTGKNAGGTTIEKKGSVTLIR